MVRVALLALRKAGLAQPLEAPMAVRPNFVAASEVPGRATPCTVIVVKDGHRHSAASVGERARSPHGDVALQQRQLVLRFLVDVLRLDEQLWKVSASTNLSLTIPA